MQASTYRGRRGVSLLALLLGVAAIAPVVGWTTAAEAQYGGITPGAPYDQSRRVARRTARRTSRRQNDMQEYYEQPAPQPYPQQYPPQPYPQQYPQPYPQQYPPPH
jgi:hypothetical protein